MIGFAGCTASCTAPAGPLGEAWTSDEDWRVVATA